jgi:hypothetical protein
MNKDLTEKNIIEALRISSEEIEPTDEFVNKLDKMLRGNRNNVNKSQSKLFYFGFLGVFSFVFLVLGLRLIDSPVDKDLERSEAPQLNDESLEEQLNSIEEDSNSMDYFVQRESAPEDVTTMAPTPTIGTDYPEIASEGGKNIEKFDYFDPFEFLKELILRMVNSI